MTTDLLAILVLIVLALAGVAANILIVVIDKQLRLQRESLKTAIGGISAVYTAQGEILNELNQLRDALNNRDKTPADTTPKSLGLTPTPVKLTPPARDPEEEKRSRRRRHHSNKGNAK